MLMRTANYMFTLKYRAGKTLMVSDALSRLPMQENEPTKEISLDVCINLVQFSPDRLKELREATQEDDTLRELRKVILSGWPARRSEVHQTVREYWSVRDSLVIDDGLILRGTSVLIPLKLRQWYVEKLHEGHQGRFKMELRAKDTLFWPGMKGDITGRVDACLPCQSSRPANPRDAMYPERQHPVPAVPWLEVSTDLFNSNGKNFLLVVDHYSKYPFVYEISNTSSAGVVKILTRLFTEQGSPSVLYSDNGPQYSSREFHDFALQFEFQHVTSSPHHPGSNGIAERKNSISNLVWYCARKFEVTVWFLCS